jgi:hypothetical protein
MGQAASLTQDNFTRTKKRTAEVGVTTAQRELTQAGAQSSRIIVYYSNNFYILSTRGDTIPWLALYVIPYRQSFKLRNSWWFYFVFKHKDLILLLLQQWMKVNLQAPISLSPQKYPLCPLHRKLGAPQSLFRCCDEDKNSYPFSESNPSLVTIFFFIFFFGLWGYWHCGHSWPIVAASGDGEDDCGEAHGM